jgi:hypothetical protein
MTTISLFDDGPHRKWDGGEDIFGFKQSSMLVPEMQMKLLPKAVAAATRPSVALVFPYNPKMMPKAEIDIRVRGVLAAAEKKLLVAHPAEMVMPVVRKLQQLVRGLSTSTHKVGVALFVSEDVSKVLYLDYEVEERVLVDEPFRVRDLADCKAGDRDFLVLLLSARESKMYWSHDGEMKLIKRNTPLEERLNTFLHFMDQGLGAVLKVYPLPVYVIATGAVAEPFTQLTRHGHQIAAVIHRDGIDLGEEELAALLVQRPGEWEAMRSRLLLQQIGKAAQAGKLDSGAEAVRKAARCRNSRLIIVGREQSKRAGGEFYSDGELDEWIEKVLEHGGVVEKLDETLLQPYGPVAVVRQY